MSRLLAVAALIIAVLAIPVRAADAPLAGSWKLTVPLEPGHDVTFLLVLTEKGGTWAGEVSGCSLDLKVLPKLVGLAVEGEKLRFSLELDGRHLLAFDGVRAKDGKALPGSYVPTGGRPRPTEMRASRLKNLSDEFEVAREAFEQSGDGPALFDAAFALLDNAGAKKLTPDEARKVVDRTTTAAAKYGTRWERETAVKLAAALSAMPELAVEQGRRAEKLLAATDDAGTRIQVLDSLIVALGRAGKADEAAHYRTELAKVEAADYAEYAKTHPAFKPTPFAGRKAKSDRVALCEVFTGAECPPCAAVDLAFDALLATYKPTDAILLQYHCHIPAPDPLTCPEGDDRLRYYVDQIEGAPTVFVNGKLGPPGGGPASAAEKKYKALRTAIDDALEKPAAVKLALKVAKTAKGFDLTASATDLEHPGERTHLRFVIAEERVRYTGGNGVRYHHMVVRAMPGGAKGFALTKKAQEQTVSVNVENIRAGLAKYLDGVPKEEGPFPRPDRPLALNGLKVIAFVQHDATRDIMQAVQVDLAP